MTSSQKYILIFLSVFFSCLAVHGVAIWKGFAIYGEGPSGFGYDSKTAFRNDGKFTKTAHVSMHSTKAEGYLIGSSRLRDGLDPATAEELTGQRFFNYGMSGLIVREMKPVVEHLLANKSPKTIVIGLDFFAFNDATTPAKDMVLQNGISAKNLLKMYLSSFSLKSARDMMDLNHQYKGLFCSANGFCHDQRFTPDQVAEYIHEGMGHIGAPSTPLHNYASYTESMDLFSQMLDELSKRKDVNVRFFFSPGHILMFHALKEKGLLPTYISWKETVSKAIMAHGYNLYDYDIQSEATDRKLNDSAPYFNDDIHYTKMFGDIILKGVLTGKADNYSVKITGESLPAILRYNREAYPEFDPARY